MNELHQNRVRATIARRMTDGVETNLSDEARRDINSVRVVAGDWNPADVVGYSRLADSRRCRTPGASPRTCR